MGPTLVGGEERGSSSERRRAGEPSNSSGVKLLRWKIALTVMMLLFRVARVTLSFSSATPVGAAGLTLLRGCSLPASEQAGVCTCLWKGGPLGSWWAAQPQEGRTILGVSGTLGPCSPELLVPVTGAWIGTQSHPVGGCGELAFMGSTFGGQLLNMHELL